MILTTALPAYAVQQDTPTYIPGRLVVKFKSTGAEALTYCAHCLFATQRSFDAATADHAVGLSALIQETGVQAIEPLFPEWHRERIEDARSAYLRDLEAVRRQFPERSARRLPEIPLPDLTHVYLFELPPDTELEAVIRRYQADPHVEYVHYDRIMIPYGVPNDPYYNTPEDGSWSQGYPDLWALKKHRMHLEAAWEVTEGQEMTVAVVDTGVDVTHEDFYHDLNGNGRLNAGEPSNIWINACEDANRNGVVDTSDFNGVDDACPGGAPNGYVDDLYGWDFVDNDNNPADREGHGTHVAGTIAARGNNHLGIIGVAPQANIMALRGLPGSEAMLANALVYAVRHGADVINNSWGCGGFGCLSPSPEMERAVQLAFNMGTVVVFAAGNSARDVLLHYPQNTVQPKVIVVASTDHADQRSDFSDTGFLLDVAAPGGESGPACSDFLAQSILSLRALGTDLYADCGSGWLGQMVVGERYYRARGTSMAAPHAAGAAALVLAAAKQRGLRFTVEDVRQALRGSADDQGEPGFDPQFGAGRLQAAAAVDMPSVLAARLRVSTLNGALTQTGEVVIEGSAAGAGFRQYQLFSGAGRMPTAWTPISDPVLTPVSDGILGRWSVNHLRVGLHWLRLAVTRQDGRQFEDWLPLVFEPGVRAIATDTSPIQPAISGNRVVWTDSRNGNADIYLYDLATNTERRLTTDPASQANPAISGDLVVWQDRRHIPNADTGERDVYLYDLATNTERRLTTDTTRLMVGLGNRLAISGTRVVWLAKGPQLYPNIYLYDLTTNAGRWIETDPWHHAHLAMDGDSIVWVDRRNASGYPDIYLYEVSTNTERRLTSRPGTSKYDTAISGRWIVWHESGPEYLQLYDLATNTERRLTTDAAKLALNDRLAISGNRVVWTDYRSTDYKELPLNGDIYLYDLATNTEQQLTAHPAEQRMPAISGSRIVWEDFRRSNTNVGLYLVQLPTAGDGFEADTAPRPQGNGTLTVADWVQVGRYVAGFDSAELQQGNAFQRADCAPRETQGDGRLTVTDWVQAGRYAAGFDNAPIAAGGPIAPIASSLTARVGSLASSTLNSSGLPSLLRPRGQARFLTLPMVSASPGQLVTIPITLTAQGGEQALSFTISVDPALLEYRHARLGVASKSATLQLQTTRTADGHLGAALIWPAGHPLSRGRHKVVLVTYRVRPTAIGRSRLLFTDTVLPLELADAQARPLPLQVQLGWVQSKPRRSN